MEVSEGWCEDYDTVNVESAKMESLQLALKAGRASTFGLNTQSEPSLVHLHRSRQNLGDETVQGTKPFM